MLPNLIEDQGACNLIVPGTSTEVCAPCPGAEAPPAHPSLPQKCGSCHSPEYAHPAQETCGASKGEAPVEGHWGSGRNGFVIRGTPKTVISLYNYGCD